MKQHQPSNFQRTCDAMNALRSLGISDSRRAAEAIRNGATDPYVLEKIRTAYSNTPEVRKALAEKIPS